MDTTLCSMGGEADRDLEYGEEGIEHVVEGEGVNLTMVHIVGPSILPKRLQIQKQISQLCPPHQKRSNLHRRNR